jgi:hypothetical protein
MKSLLKIFQRPSPSVTFPDPLMEVCEREVRVSVHNHALAVGESQILCWTYITDGMQRWGQKELALTIRRRSHEGFYDFPHDPFYVFNSISGMAVQGHFAEAGDRTEFNLPVLVGYSGIGYVEGEHLPGYPAPEGEYLQMILLHQQETAVWLEHGAARILALLGQQARHFPFPIWCEQGRKPLALKKVIAESRLNHVATLRIPDTYGSLNNHYDLRLKLPDKGRHLLDEALRECLREDTALAVLLPLDPTATAHMTYNPGNSGPTGIAPGQPGDTRVSGAFLLLIPLPEGESKIGLAEDGFVVALSPTETTRLQDTLQTDRPFLLHDPESGINFSF